ncbi:HAD family hydrolase [Streptococcus ovis]|uniref:HAD family hydrolase n=1 Tax=Streptococcus ovis TaxID=82806 RepID=UPI000382AD92|nr:HAD family phosphatase [Streptococcus ovis]
MRYKAIIFDMDGVLFETEEFYYHRRATFLTSKGISIRHIDPAFFVGGRASQIWPEILGSDIDQWNVPALEKEYEDYKTKHGAPYGELVFPDAKVVLSVLKEKGLRLALASNTDRGEVERALQEAGIYEFFDAIFSATECHACKPDPEVYEKAWAYLGQSKEETLVVEDSEKGIAAGVAAGLTVWAIRDTKWQVNQSQADKLIEGLSDLLKE